MATATYDDAVITYNYLIVDYDGTYDVVAESGDQVIKISKKRHQRMEDYLGVGNALIHR